MFSCLSFLLPTFLYFQHLRFLPHYACDKVTVNLLPFLTMDTTQRDKACFLDRQEHEKHNSEKKRLTCFNKQLLLCREVCLETTNRSQVVGHGELALSRKMLFGIPVFSYSLGMAEVCFSGMHLFLFLKTYQQSEYQL